MSTRLRSCSRAMTLRVQPMINPALVQRDVAPERGCFAQRGQKKQQWTMTVERKGWSVLDKVSEESEATDGVWGEANLCYDSGREKKRPKGFPPSPHPFRRARAASWASDLARLGHQGMTSPWIESPTNQGLSIYLLSTDMSRK